MSTRLAEVKYTDPSFARGKHQPMVDLKRGGQHGHLNDYEAWCSHAPYVRQNTIPRLITAPRGYRDLPNPQIWYTALKSIIELHSKTIGGLNSTLSVDSAQQAFGGAGEQHDVPVNVTRARTEPSHSVDEKYGRPVTEFLEGWILNLIGDPETKYPNVLKQEGVIVPDLLPDYYSCSVLYIEPDPTGRRCMHAWYVTNMYPTEGPSREGARDMTSSKEDLTIDITFTGITQTGIGVNNFGQLVLDALNMANVNPHHRPVYHHGSTDKFNPDSEANLKGQIAKQTGFHEMVNQAHESFIKP